LFTNCEYEGDSNYNYSDILHFIENLKYNSDMLKNSKTSHQVFIDEISYLKLDILLTDYS